MKVRDKTMINRFRNHEISLKTFLYSVSTVGGFDFDMVSKKNMDHCFIKRQKKRRRKNICFEYKQLMLINIT